MSAELYMSDQWKEKERKEMTPPDILASWEKEANIGILKYSGKPPSGEIVHFISNQKILSLISIVREYREALKERETGIDLALAMLRNFNSDESKKIIDKVLDKALAHQVDEEKVLKGETK